ncbi:MAG: flavin-dependent oxidoreductase [Xanthobacteraceae bacterium]|nr:flavin-dependent oxidoreductase [Xanthobacteraceae bacterium]
MDIAIVGGGIVGLSLALNLHKRGLKSTVYEAAPEVKELGVGITLLPHAMRELAALGLKEQLEQQGIANQESCFFNRFGQLIYREPRGYSAGYRYPEIGMHRGRLHKILWQAAQERLGAEKLRTNHKCVGFSQNSDNVSLRMLETSSGDDLDAVKADLVIACDGVNSSIRQQLFPTESVIFTGINTWRGVTRHKPFLSGKSYVRVGSINSAKIVIYPIVEDVDGQGNQLINWTTEILDKGTARNDWNKPGNISDFISRYQSWQFSWLDIPAMIRSSDVVFEYPMVDKDPIRTWTFGRVVLAGDAAHPMYPRGSNGSAQGLIDSRVLSDALAQHGTDWQSAFRAYEHERVEKAAAIVRTNRSTPPDFINIKVEELTGDQPIDDLDRYISQDELRAMSDRYKKTAGFSPENLQ